MVLGHVLRGGQPCAADRVLAARFGHHAVNLLLTGMRNRLVVARNGELHDVDITSAANKQRLVPPTHSLVLAARALLTCFGDVPCHLSLASASAIQQMAMRAVKLSKFVFFKCSNYFIIGASCEKGMIVCVCVCVCVCVRGLDSSHACCV